MSTRITIFVLLVAFVAIDASGQNRRFRRRGALLGGLAGAAIGAAIGDKGDNETAGALIGGAVGAVAGGTIGNQKDQRIEHNYRYHSGHSHYSRPQQTYPYQSYPTYRQPAYGGSTTVYPQRAAPIAPAVPTDPDTRPLMPQDVVAMVQNGLGEDTIIRKIQVNGVARPLTVNEVIQLDRAGVRETIINAMQTAATTISTQPVVIDSPRGYPNPPASPTRRYHGPSILAPNNGP